MAPPAPANVAALIPGTKETKGQNELAMNPPTPNAVKIPPCQMKNQNTSIFGCESNRIHMRIEIIGDKNTNTIPSSARRYPASQGLALAAYAALTWVSFGCRTALNS